MQPCPECATETTSHAPTCPKNPDMLMARRVRRKVERIVQATYDTFLKKIADCETLSADEIMMCGVNLLELVTIQPLQKMAADPLEMRAEMARQIATMIEQGGEE